MTDVFISYSKIRRTEAAELARELSDLGYYVWWDTRLLPTGSYGAAIDRELNAAKAVIVIWSPESVRSKWVRSEAEHADQQDKLVNTHTDVDDPRTLIPKPFNQIHSVAIDDIRAIVSALDALNVPRSGGKATPEPAVEPAGSVADADDRLFAEVEKANSIDAYEYYLAELPQGRHAPIAKFRLLGLRQQMAPAAAPPPPMQRRRAYASRNIGRLATVSALALIGFRPPFGSLHQYGIRPQRSGSSETSPVLWLRRMTSRSWLGAALYRGG
jgi:TIR domain